MFITTKTLKYSGREDELNSLAGIMQALVDENWQEAKRLVILRRDVLQEGPAAAYEVADYDPRDMEGWSWP